MHCWIKLTVPPGVVIEGGWARNGAGVAVTGEPRVTVTGAGWAVKGGTGMSCPLGPTTGGGETRIEGDGTVNCVTWNEGGVTRIGGGTMVTGLSVGMSRHRWVLMPRKSPIMAGAPTGTAEGMFAADCSDSRLGAAPWS